MARQVEFPPHGKMPQPSNSCSSHLGPDIKVRTYYCMASSLHQLLPLCVDFFGFLLQQADDFGVLLKYHASIQYCIFFFHSLIHNINKPSKTVLDSNKQTNKQGPLTIINNNSSHMYSLCIVMYVKSFPISNFAREEAGQLDPLTVDR